MTKSASTAGAQPISDASSEPTKPQSPPEPDPHSELYLIIIQAQAQLQVQEYVSEELSRRLNAVNGQILLNFLQNVDLDRPSKADPAVAKALKTFAEHHSESDWTGVINTMIKKNLLKRVVPLTVNKKRYATNQTIRINFADRGAQQYDPDGLYAFIIQPPQSRFAMAKSLGIVGGILALCCFKIWPIILRIGMWWLLVFTTAFLITSIVIHLLSKILFTLMCLRGYSFMPNLLDEEIGFFETFSPVLGTGGEHQRRWALEREIQVRARQKLGLGKATAAELAAKANNAESGVAPTTPNSEEESPGTPKATVTDDKATPTAAAASATPLTAPPVNIFHTWQAGLFAFVVFFIFGAIGCYNMGFFDPEMVPDFLVNNSEMRYYFPALAATATEHEEASGDAFAETFDKGEHISI